MVERNCSRYSNFVTGAGHFSVRDPSKVGQGLAGLTICSVSYLCNASTPNICGAGMHSSSHSSGLVCNIGSGSTDYMYRDYIDRDGIVILIMKLLSCL